MFFQLAGRPDPLPQIQFQILSTCAIMRCTLLQWKGLPPLALTAAILAFNISLILIAPRPFSRDGLIHFAIDSANSLAFAFLAAEALPFT